MVYIENDCALFRGISRGIPTEVWSQRLAAWKPYNFDDAFKPVEWGTIVSEAEAEELKRY